ncbi:hypothetical protein [Polyangium sp. 6x1]|uniref:hypothetical protein n=1 Tax=Polyangium sp. 6x1 TaxID=3042689 RepID=UPI0024827966|nr:hypothetical protein [Polyangium sp. 6x1]MDI1449862.1 hypothetical protein [Polyangium sp. 6x1]
MKPRRARILGVVGLVAVGVAWLQGDDELTPVGVAPKDTVEVGSPPPPAPAPRSAPAARLTPPPEKEERSLSPALREQLHAYNDLKKRTLFPADLDGKLEAIFAGKDMLAIAGRFLSDSALQEAYVSEDEDMRITLVDYVGDAALGRFSFEDETQARQLLLRLLDMPLLLSGKELRQAKSLMGDRIELMAYYTQIDGEGAKAYLVRHRGQDVYEHLAKGYSNGLYALGHGAAEIEGALAEAR